MTTQHHTDHVNFINDVLTSQKSRLVLFYDDFETDAQEHLKLLEAFKEKVPSFSFYLYKSSDEKNAHLAHNLGVEQSCVLMMFKSGSVNRWLENGRKTKINAASILKFIGSPALYGISSEEAKKISDSMTKSFAKVKKEKPAKLESVAKPQAKEIKKPAKKKALKIK